MDCSALRITRRWEVPDSMPEMSVNMGIEVRTAGRRYWYTQGNSVNSGSGNPGRLQVWRPILGNVAALVCWSPCWHLMATVDTLTWQSEPEPGSETRKLAWDQLNFACSLGRVGTAPSKSAMFVHPYKYRSGGPPWQTDSLSASQGIPCLL